MRISIKAARTDKNLTQAEFAKAVGVTKKTVWAWENGKSKPNVNKIEPICSVLGVSYDNIRWNG